MIVYCLGSASEKRKHFLSQTNRREVEYLDNDETVEVKKTLGKTLFAVGEIPFDKMRVGEFISYQRSNLTDRRILDKETKYYARLFKMNIPLKKRMGALALCDYRKAQFLAGYCVAVREVYINFDGLEYSRKNARKLACFIEGIKRYFNLYIAVSDSRFVPPLSRVREYDEQGKYQEVNGGAYKSRRVSRKALVSKEKYLKIKKVVETSLVHRL